MKSIVKLIGISSCCIALGTAAANADPVPLADAELDRVAAGVIGVQWPIPKFHPAFLDPPAPPLEPGENIPVHGPGCNTGGGPCQYTNPDPLPSTPPSFELIAIDGSPPVQPFTFQFPLGGCGGPATLCAGPTGPFLRP